jgi:hypothetical protein
LYLYKHVRNGRAEFSVLETKDLFRYGHDLAVPKKLIDQFLTKKTIGSLVVANNDGDLACIAASTSGSFNESTRPMGVISQPKWIRRTRSIAKTIRIKMGSMYDTQGGVLDGGKTGQSYGRYQSDHVEPKLATFAVYLVCRQLGLLQDQREVTAEHLKRLKSAIMASGKRKQFFIFVSRHPCERCSRFVRLLSKKTGLKLRIKWLRLLQNAPEPSYRRVDKVFDNDLKNDSRDNHDGNEEDQEDGSSDGDNSSDTDITDDMDTDADEHVMSGTESDIAEIEILPNTPLRKRNVACFAKSISQFKFVPNKSYYPKPKPSPLYVEPQHLRNNSSRKLTC